MRASLVAALALLASASPGPARAFSDDFSAGLGQWYPVVYDSFGSSATAQAPAIDPGFGLPAGSLNPFGDASCGNAAYSTTAFDLASGLDIRFDMFVASVHDWNWALGGLSSHAPNLAAPRGDGAYLDATRCDPELLAVVAIVDDNSYGSNPPSFGVAIMAEDGTGDGWSGIEAASLQNAWHAYRILIRPDGFVEFSVDGALVYTTTKRIDRSRGALPLLLGDRSASDLYWGYPGVRYDNVSVTVPVLAVAVDVRPGSAANPVNVGARGTVPVAILSTEGFDAPAAVVGSSLRFGATGEEASLVRCGPAGEDVNADGLRDLLCHFDVQRTGFTRASTLGILKGSTASGQALLGADAVTVVR